MAVQATGRLGEREGRDALVYERTFTAPVDDVWAAVTEPERLAAWIGTWTGDPASGAVNFTMHAEGDDVPAATYRIDTCDRPHHLAVRAVDEAGIWSLYLDLASGEGVTTLTFAQVIHDAGLVESVGPGWDWYLDRLVAAQTGADPAALDFDRDYDPALRPHYLAIQKLVTGG